MVNGHPLTAKGLLIDTPWRVLVCIIEVGLFGAPSDVKEILRFHSLRVRSF